MKKIVLIANTSQSIFSFRKELIQSFQVDTKLVISNINGNEEDLRNMGCKLIGINIERRGKNPLNDLMLFRQYFKILKEEKPDAVLTYHIKPNIYAGIACKLLGIDYFPNITGLGTAVVNPGMLQKLTTFLYKHALLKAKCIFFQNRGNLEFFQDHNMFKKGANVHLLPGSGINLDKFVPLDYPEDTEKIKFLFIGRIMKDKGIVELIEAFRICKEKYPLIELDILGCFDEDYKDLVDQAEREGLVKYHGFQKDVVKFIKDAHAIVLPSYHEGMSNTLLEAAASARPVIATNVHGCIETFDEGISGFSCEAKDVNTLVDAMRKFIELPYNEKVEMGLKGREKVEKEFDRQIVVDAYMKEVFGNE